MENSAQPACPQSLPSANDAIAPSRRWIVPVTLFCVLFLACVGIARYAQFRNVPSSQSNGLEMRAQDLDFGVAWENREFPWKLALTNRSSSPVRIASFVTTCSCLECTPETLELQPQQTADLKLRLDLTRAFANAKPNAGIARFYAELRPNIEGQGPIGDGWSIQGNVRRGLVFEETPLRIKDRLIRGRSFPVQATDFSLHSSLRDAHVAVRCPSEFAIARIMESPPASGNFRLQVTLNPNLEAGEISFDVLLDIEPRGGESVVQVLRVIGNVEEVVQIVPSRLVFGAERLGARKSQYVRFVGIDSDRFVVKQVTVPPGDTSCVPGNRPDTYEVSVEFSQAGSQQRMIQFDLELPSEKRSLRLLLPLAYHGR